MRVRPMLSRALSGLAVAGGLLGLCEISTQLLWGPPPPAVQVLAGPAADHGWLRIEGDTLLPAYMGPEAESHRFPIAHQRPRVAVLGGSSAQGGSRLPPAIEFPALIGASLGVDVQNLAWPGMDSFELLDLLEALIALPDGPPIDALIVYTGHNDFANLFYQKRFGDLSGGAVAHTRALLERSRLYVLLRRALWRPAGHASNAFLDHAAARDAVSADARSAAVHYFEANMRRIAWVAQQADLPMLLMVPASNDLIFPASPDCTQTPCAMQTWTAARDTASPEGKAAGFIAARDQDPIPLRAPSAAREAVRRVAADARLPLIDTPNLLEQDSTAPLPAAHLFIDHVHLSPSGHRAFADLVVDRADALGVRR